MGHLPHEPAKLRSSLPFASPLPSSPLHLPLPPALYHRPQGEAESHLIFGFSFSPTKQHFHTQSATEARVCPAKILSLGPSLTPVLPILGLAEGGTGLRGEKG